MPERVYTKKELGGYVLHCKAKCLSVVGSLTERASLQRCGFARHNMTVLELLLYAHRHVQHHVGQLALMLRQEQGVGLPWVSTSTPARA